MIQQCVAFVRQFYFFIVCLLVFSGVFPPEHPAEHQLQDVCEE